MTLTLTLNTPFMLNTLHDTTPRFTTLDDTSRQFTTPPTQHFTLQDTSRHFTTAPTQHFTLHDTSHFTTPPLTSLHATTPRWPCNQAHTTLLTHPFPHTSKLHHTSSSIARSDTHTHFYVQTHTYPDVRLTQTHIHLRSDIHTYPYD
jgi:hypothetical protein